MNTARKDDPATAQTVAARLRAAFDALPARSAIIDPTGVILETNDAWSIYACERGIDPKLAGVGTNYLDALHLKGEDGSEIAVRAAEGISCVLKGGRTVFRMCYPCPQTSGEMWYDLIVSTLDTGSGLAALITHQPIIGEGLRGVETLDENDRDHLAALFERDRMLEEAHRRISDTAEHMPGFVYSYDFRNGERRTIFIGPGLDEIVGPETAAEVGGDMSRLRALIHPDDRAEVDRSAAESLRTREIVDITYRIRTDGDVYKWVRIRAKPRVFSEGWNRWHGLMIDIDEQKRTEEALQHARKMEAVAQLAAGMAHDLSNLLTALFGFTETALSPLTTADAGSHALRQIEQTLHEARVLTESLLLFSRRGRSSFELVDLGDVLARASEVIRQLLPDTVSLEVSVSQDNAHVWGDSSQLLQVILNLALNARDAMPDGGAIRITIAPDAAPTADSDRARRVRISVEDEGKGIREEDLSRIFEPFYTTKQRGRGTGLGLAVSDGIVTDHGGTIDVATSESGGARFDVVLTMADKPEGHRVSLAASTPGERRGVVVCENDRLVRGVLASTLEAHGFEVELIDDRGLTQLDPAAFDTLIIEANLLSENVTRHIQTMTSGAGGPHLVVLGEPADDRVSKLGVARVLSKPFDMSDLLEALAPAIRAGEAAGAGA